MVSTRWISDAIGWAISAGQASNRRCTAVSKVAGAEKARKRRAEDQEREERQQSGKRHMACHRPAVILAKVPIGIPENFEGEPVPPDGRYFFGQGQLRCDIAQSMGRSGIGMIRVTMQGTDTMDERKTIIVTGCSSGIGAHAPGP